MTNDRWALMLGTAYTGSSIYQNGCHLAGARAGIPTGKATDGTQGFSSNIVHGDQLVTSYLINQVFPTLAANAKATFAFTMKGLPATGASGVTVSPFSGNGLAGLSWTTYAVADGSGSVTFTNISGASLTPPTQSVRLQMISSSS
jgi:hypothetical protein